MIKLLKAGAYLLGIGLAGYTIFLMWPWVRDSQAIPQGTAHSDTDIETQVTATLIPYDRDCPGGYPMGVALHNGGTETVSWVTVEIKARRRGYSSGLIGPLRDMRYADRFIAPGEDYEMCESKPQLAVDNIPEAEIEYLIDVAEVRFGNP